MVDRRRHRSGPRSEPAPQAKPPTIRAQIDGNIDWLRGLLKNSARESKEILTEGYRSPISSLFTVSGYIGTIIAAVTYLIDQISGNGSSSGFNSASTTFPFALRLAFYFFMSASIGWTVSALGITLTKHPSPWANLTARFGTFIAALFLATGIDWLFPLETQNQPGLVLALAVAGCSFAVYLAKTNYALTHETSHRVISLRAELLLIFALGLTGTVLTQTLIGSAR